MRSRHLPSAVLLGVTTLMVLACGEQAQPLASTGQRPEAFLSGLVGTLMACNPMPGDTTTQVIGPDGGTLFVGPHKLRVPAGALAAPVTITAIAPSDTVNRIVFAPAGLTFQESAWLTMSYANCSIVTWLLPKRIAYTTDALDIIKLLFSFDNLWARRVSADIDHFSTYAVAW